MTRLIIPADNASFREVFLPTAFEPLLEALLALAFAPAIVVTPPPVERPPSPTLTVASTSADGTPSLLITIPVFTPLSGRNYSVVAVDVYGVETPIIDIFPGAGGPDEVSWSPPTPAWAGTVHLAASYQGERVVSL